MKNDITKRQKLEEELDDTEKSCKYEKKKFQRFQRGEFSLALRLCQRLSQRQGESLRSLVFLHVLSLNKSPVEKTRRSIVLGPSFPLQAPCLQMEIVTERVIL